MSSTARTIKISATTAIVSLGLAALSMGGAAAAPRAHAAGSDLKCAKTAKIVAHHGAGKIVIFGVRHPVGDTFHGTKIKRHNVYQLSGERITLRFGSDRFTLSNGSIFKLGCSGDAVGDPAVMPSLDVLRGKIGVHTTAARHGSVFTEEALFGVVAGTNHAMSYTVTRTTKKKKLSITDLVNWFTGDVNQPTGTSTVATTSKVNANVTPYVGPHHGSCRSVRSAKLVTKGSFGHGSAEYHF